MTIAMIFIGTVALILLGGYVKTMDIGLKSYAINNQYGDFQIAKKGYFAHDSTSMDYTLSKDEFNKLENFLYTFKEVDFINKRVFIAGLIGNYKTSTFFSGICGQADTEVFMLPDLIKGKIISPSDPYGIIIGRGMAEKLDVTIGDNLLLFFSSEGGSQEAIRVSVRGIYKGLLKEQENIIVYIPLKAAWDLMLTKKIHTMLVFLKDEKQIKTMMQKVKSFALKNNMDIELKSWKDLAVYYKQVIGMISNIIIFGGIIVFFVIIFGISNTMYMVINNRTREIGTMRAFGKKRSEILFYFVCEGLFMGLFGAIIGILFSIIIIPVINAMNFTLPPGPGQDNPIPIHIIADNIIIIKVMIINIITSVFASFLPAFNASRKNIVNALRQF